MRITKEQVLSDSSTSFWLKEAIPKLLKRDPVDALNDIEVLRKIIIEEIRNPWKDEYPIIKLRH